MQDYSKPQGRNISIAAGSVGGNPSQGAGFIADKVSVPLPGTNATQPAYKGGVKPKPAGFDNGLIDGKVKA